MVHGQDLSTKTEGSEIADHHRWFLGAWHIKDVLPIELAVKI